MLAGSGGPGDCDRPPPVSIFFENSTWCGKMKITQAIEKVEPAMGGGGKGATLLIRKHP